MKQLKCSNILCYFKRKKSWIAKGGNKGMTNDRTRQSITIAIFNRIFISSYFDQFVDRFADFPFVTRKARSSASWHSKTSRVEREKKVEPRIKEHRGWQNTPNTCLYVYTHCYTCIHIYTYL